MKRSRIDTRARLALCFPQVLSKIIEDVSDFNRCSSSRNWQSPRTSTLPGSFRGKNSYSYLFSHSSFVGISAFCVSFKYYHAPVGAQLNRHATSILRQMQGEHRDQEPSERHAQERKGCRQGRMPQLRDLSLPHRKGLERTSSISPSTFTKVAG